MRSQWVAARTARINALRGLLSEFGLSHPSGAKRFPTDLPRLLDDPDEKLPARVHRLVMTTYEEIPSLEARIEAIERELRQLVREEPSVAALEQILGIGVLTATAMYATVGNVHAFKTGRHLASCLGRPHENSPVGTAGG